MLPFQEEQPLLCVKLLSRFVFFFCSQYSFWPLDGDKTMCTRPLRSARIKKQSGCFTQRKCKGIWSAVKAFCVVAAQWLTNVLKQQPKATLWQRRTLRPCGWILLDLSAAYVKILKQAHSPTHTVCHTITHFFVLFFFPVNIFLHFSPPATPGLDRHKRGSENLREEIMKILLQKIQIG